MGLDDDIHTERLMSRRTVLRGLLGASVVALGATGCRLGGGTTDSDTGPNADAAGRGRGSRDTGVTDSDTGPNADAAGEGTGTGSTSDSDSGPNADPAGEGRGG